MERFVTHKAVVAPLDRADVDTDQIIPKQFLKRVERTGFGRFLFHDWRLEPSFVLDDPRYTGAGILVTGRNFGCGSSREHAPWALADFGFRAIVAPSFADIFANNCLKNGLLPVALSDPEVAYLMGRAATGTGYRATVDLERREVRDDAGFVARFEIDPFWRSCLMEGLDEIGLTLLHEPAIGAFERHRT